ncbi:uncharacterized protein EKO05_0005087 [Ascochyta rabiei]|uniref:uncharacterized protein n=1 Tax=Didymella rabiei TaxID=5454 RepID=UPI0022015167|nr:uncharacterized protein EKO05_0005087 [Ascochyta rabiei]UPX14610.1 hypothetical protein EKO05_0005087 [Ascochyta rabiei]
MLTRFGSHTTRTFSATTASLSPTMVVPADQTLLFTLPLELRELIYRAVLSSPLDGTELLRTCREIYLEAQKFLFERPLSFRSQSVLFHWLNRVPPEYLPQAKVLSLNIQEVDLRSLLSAPALVSHPGDPPRLLTWELYEAELERLNHALRQLPKIQRIIIRAVSGRQSFLYRECLQRFLGMLGSLYPDLVDISLEGKFHHQSLSFLSSFKKLEAFSFDGFSASSPSETAGVLAGLQRLTSLSLVSQGTMLSPGSHMHSDYTAKRQSFTGGVVNKMDNLTCFSVTETIPVSAPTLFFTPEILNSLQKHQSLRKLKVCLSQTPDHDTLTAMRSFLEHTQIRILDLDWPDLEPNAVGTFSLMPECLEELWIRAKSTADAFDIIWSIAESRKAGEVQALYELVLVRTTQMYGIISPFGNERKDSGAEGTTEYADTMCPAPNETEAINLGRAQRCLQVLGVRVSWYTEQC